MRTIEIHIPDEVNLKDADFSMIIASKLYEDGKCRQDKQLRLQDYPRELLLNY